MEIRDMSDEEIEKFLKERKENREQQKRANSRPVLLTDKNKLYNTLAISCETYIADIINGNDVDSSGMKQYLFEDTMECLYGHSVWEWINKNT